MTKNYSRHTCLIEKYSPKLNKYYIIPKIDTFFVVKKGICPDGLMVVISDDLIYTETKNKINRKPSGECWVKCYVFKTNKIELLRADWYDECINLWEEL